MRHISPRCLFLAFFAMVPAIFAFTQDRNVLASQINTAAVRITNSQDIAAYHSRLPLSTMLRVTNLDNFRSVEVRVMGRASGNSGDMLLLSEEAARIVGLSGSDQIPVRVDVITGQAATTIPLEPLGDLAEEQPAPYSVEEEPSTMASASYWEDDEEEIEDTYPSYSYEPDPVEPPPPPPPPRAPVVSVTPAPAAPQPPVRTVLPNQPQVAVTQSPAQAGAGTSEQPIRVTLNINGRDYVFEIPGDRQPPPAGSPAYYGPPAGPPYYDGPPMGSTTYYIPDVVVPPPAAPPPPPPAPPPSPPAPLAPTVSPIPPSGNAATIIPSIPDPNSRAVYRVQVGSFENRNLARAAFERLKDAGFNPAYEPYNNLFRVVISGVRAADIPQVARRLGAAGFTSAWIRKEN